MAALSIRHFALLVLLLLGLRSLPLRIRQFVCLVVLLVLLLLGIVSLPLRICIWCVQCIICHFRVKRLEARIAQLKAEATRIEARYAKERAQSEFIHQYVLADIHASFEAEKNLKEYEYTKDTFHRKLTHIAAIRRIHLDHGLHLTSRNPASAYTESEKGTMLEWTTGPAARMRYELLAPKDHKLVSAAILIQRRVRVRQRRMRVVKTCQRRIRQLLWIRYELCNPHCEFGRRFILKGFEEDMDTYNDKWGRLKNCWNRYKHCK